MNRMMVMTVSTAWVLGAVGAAPLTLAADRVYAATLGHRPANPFRDATGAEWTCGMWTDAAGAACAEPFTQVFKDGNLQGFYAKAGALDVPYCLVNVGTSSIVYGAHTGNNALFPGELLVHPRQPKAGDAACVGVQMAVPRDGFYATTLSVRALNTGDGDGVTATLVVAGAAQRAVKVSGRETGTNAVTFVSPLARLRAGDVVAVVVDPGPSHACDSTALRFTVTREDVVAPEGEMVADRIRPVEFHHGELGGLIDEKVMNLVSNHYLKLDLDGRWVSKFRDRTVRGDAAYRYEGVGKVLDAGSLLAAYTRDPVVAARTRGLLEGLRATRDPDGYIGFWTVEPENKQDYINWTLHEQEYLLLGMMRYHLCTGDATALDDARKMADYIVATFPTEENGIDAKYPAHTICTAGLPEAFLALYRVTHERKYLDFAANTKHGCDGSEVKCMSLRSWQQGIDEYPNHVYVMTARCYAQTELYRIDGSDSLLTMSRRMLDALFTRNKGGMLVTGSCSQGEHFTYNQDGAGAVGESCVTAYMLRWLESLMRLDGDFATGDVLERTIYNALFAATSPDGSRIRYFTPLTGERKWDTMDGGFCCCGNFRRALAEVPRKVIYVASGGTLAVNLFAPFRKTFKVDGKTFTLRCETEYPSEGTVRYTFETGVAELPFAFRVPRWAKDMTVAVNGAAPKAVAPNANRLHVVTRSWKAGDTVELALPMRLRTIRGRETQTGRVSLLRGPQVFCLGTAQNAALYARHPDFRSLWIDTASFGALQRDDSIRPNGRKFSGRAWLDLSRRDETVEVVFTEYPDPSGIETFFKIPELEDDEIISR